jgi:hypothetical protein
LLSATVSGLDAKGDQWTLQLIGPGSLTVTKQPDSSGNPAPLESLSDIDTITIGGLNPLTSKLIDHVTPAAGSDGRVFFDQLDELPSRSDEFSNGLGPLSINIPDFWLANTTPASSTATPSPPAINIPDGVNTLRFGGVDTTIGQTNPPPSTASSDQYTVELGQPQFGGTRIIIDKSISSAQTVTSSSSSTATSTIQHAVVFAVSGRLDLFQANEIDGDADLPPGQFENNNANASGFGGTWVVSGTPNITGFQAPFFANSQLEGASTGQIGNIRIGGNATNLSSFVFDGTGTGNARISNFSVGGETNNVMIIAPNSLHNAVFGKGMDNVDIYTHIINTLQANRDALNSQVFVDRTISNAMIGGPVNNTDVITGVMQNYQNIYDNVTGQSSNPIISGSVSAPPLPLNAQTGGGMTVLVAGDVTDSVFSASVQPGTTTTTSSGVTVPQFGGANDLVLPTGKINAKVEGTIDNSNATPDQPTRAFYAKSVNLSSGPVVPPNAPEAPYTGHQTYVRLPGIAHPQRAGTFTRKST